jgi:hypothetical protein
MSSDDKSSELVNVFLKLLKDHRGLLTRQDRASTAPLTRRFEHLLSTFRTILATAAATSREHAIHSHHSFESLLASFATALQAYRAGQKLKADDFNILAVLQLTQKEIRHSMVLAWMLDHDMSKLGTHAQGALGFRMFLRVAGLPESYADHRYWVRREVAGDESVVDLEIASRGNFLIHIENKIWSAEGQDQTDREWADVRRRSLQLGIDWDKGRGPVHALFLTPRAAKPLNPNFHPIGWGRVVAALDLFAQFAVPHDVKLFARHYARALTRFIVLQDSQGDHLYA